MNCPYCNRVMEKGHIYQMDFKFPLQWYPDNRGTGLLASAKRDVKLTTFLKGARVIAYRCERCRKIIIDESMLDT